MPSSVMRTINRPINQPILILEFYISWCRQIVLEDILPVPRLRKTPSCAFKKSPTR